MPFVQRNDHDQIIAVFRDDDGQGLEELEVDDPELMDFLEQQDDDIVAEPEDGPPALPMASGPRKRVEPDPVDGAATGLGETDLRLIRALEDLIELLERKGFVSETELPQPVQDLLLKRRNMRQMLRDLRAQGMLDNFG